MSENSDKSLLNLHFDVIEVVYDKVSKRFGSLTDDLIEKHKEQPLSERYQWCASRCEEFILFIDSVMDIYRFQIGLDLHKLSLMTHMKSLITIKRNELTEAYIELRSA